MPIHTNEIAKKLLASDIFKQPQYTLKALFDIKFHLEELKSYNENFISKDLLMETNKFIEQKALERLVI